MSPSRIAEAATVLRNAQVLFAGGEALGQALGASCSDRRAELYTPWVRHEVGDNGLNRPFRRWPMPRLSQH
jgi:hypothetical protein